MSKTVDTGTPPESVQARDRIRELIMSGESIPEDTSVAENSELPKPLVDLTPVKTNKKVTLIHSTYKLTLPVIDVSIGDHQVAVRLPINGVKFEPIELNSEFQIEYLNQIYDVVYLGGIFDFSDNWVIAFIRNNT